MAIMSKYYVTFGQSHSHTIDGKLLHKDVVARYDADSYAEDRERAWEMFGPKLCFCYFGDEWESKELHNMKYFIQTLFLCLKFEHYYG